MVTAFHRGKIYYCPKDGYLDVNGALFEVGDLDVFRLATEKESPQSKQEWSEEDENHVKSILSTIECCKAMFPNVQAAVESYNADIKWLKSLKDRYAWKPSDEQMNVIAQSVAVLKVSGYGELGDRLGDISEQLNKLR